MRNLLPIALIAFVGCAKVSGKKIEVVYQTIETLPEQRTIHQAIVREFEKIHPTIRVRVVYDSSKFQKLNVQLAGSAAPDVFYYIADRLPDLSKRGVLVDLSTRFHSVSSKYYSEIVHPCSVDGKLWMVPIHFSTDILYYNRDWFEKAAVEFPNDKWNWETFAQIAAKLRDQKQTRFGTLLPRALLLIQSFGGDVFSEKYCVIDSGESAAALSFYRSLVVRGIAPTTVSASEMEAFDGVNLFRAQKIPLLVGRTYMLTEFDKITGFRWGVAPVPKGKLRWSRLSIGGNCIWKGTKHTEEAWKFAMFYSQEAARLTASHRNAIPAIQPGSNNLIFPEEMVAAIQYSRLDNPWGYIFWDEFNQKAFVETADAVALGSILVNDALGVMKQTGAKFLEESFNNR